MPYFDAPLPDEILRRYGLLRSGNYNDVPDNEAYLAEIARVDDAFDTQLQFGGDVWSSVRHLEIKAEPGPGAQFQKLEK